ncbi:MAG: heavy metal translocating P-type ATPase [Candidatus Delongbacteria bacterium]|jgi:heavy metal translocating P-type ATPase|nr:heavy metal translocating P-type ATPase [Candidatus Delongbacteria bacterium]
MKKIIKKQGVINDMHCKSCADKVEKALSSHEAVKHVKVNITKKIATIEFDISQITEHDLKALVKNVGYTLLFDSSDKGNDKPAHQHEHKAQEHHNHEHTHSKYACPMKCEGDKVYQEPGNCPLCGMHLKPIGDGNEHHQHNHQHEHHSHSHEHVEKGNYFCPMHCEGDKTYDKPGDCPVCGMHLKKEETQAKQVGGKTIYTCPMHPEVKQEGPGSCPKCGMDLVPENGGDVSDEEKAYKKMAKKFWIALILSVPVFIIAMSDFIPFINLEDFASKKVWGWIEFTLATPVVFYSSWDFFKRGWSSIVRRMPNMWTLISIGVGAAYLFSVLALLLPSLFPPQFKGAQGNVHLYFEAAAVILTLVLFGQVLELRAHSKTNSAIKALLGLVPPVARVIRNGEELEIPLEEVKVGDLLKVKPGEKIPVDGSIKEGTAVIDESMITGEPIPAEKSAGDKVTGGTINGKTAFEIKAEKVGSNTLLAQIIEMVNKASRSRAPIQKLADTVAKYFVQIVISVAILTFTVWAIWGPEPAYVYAFVNAVAVLIVACPCALGLATPMSIMVGSGRMAQAGVLVKNARAIEELNKVDTLIIDKTGTITEGKPGLKAFKSFGNLSDTDILQLAASVDANSEHPLADAIVAGAKANNIEVLKLDKFESVTGKGVQAIYKNEKIGLGNHRLMEDFKITLDDKNSKIVEEWQATGQTVMYLIHKNKVEGIVSVADKIKETSAKAIKELQAMGVKVHMLTGDNKLTAKAVADELRLDGFQPECLPEDKYNKVKELQEQGHVVAMAGDGINDAPALEQASVGIAMGTGTDIAMQSAEITLVKGDLNGIVRARELSQKVMRNVKQNLFFAFVYNSLGVPVAAGILFPFFGILLSPMIAAAAMSFSSVSVITNALRLKNK